MVWIKVLVAVIWIGHSGICVEPTELVDGLDVR